MNIEEFREYCLSLGEVKEKMPFGKFAQRFDSLLVFYVLDHMFCFVDIEDFTAQRQIESRGNCTDEVIVCVAGCAR